MELSQNSKELHISQSRTSEDVLQMLEHAKIDNSELIPLTQSLYFSNTFGDEDDLKLIEVDNDMLKYLNEGKRFTIRGDGEESSVLCTDSKTFEVKRNERLREAETSNSLLLVPNLEIPQDEREDTLTVSNQKVVSIQYKYFELKTMSAEVGKINQMP
ncbi:Sister chromatid cohesion protein DCC1 [Armadillidium vulgare]|nr:Sister chromatid cohesion protein DCC1 [Armadillidium vulgare]